MLTHGLCAPTTAGTLRISDDLALLRVFQQTKEGQQP
jgi:hypothetical protein